MASKKSGKLILTIRPSDIILFVLFLIFIEIDSLPHLIKQIPNAAFSYLPLGISVIMILITLIERKKLSSTLILIIVFFLWFLLMTALKNRSALNAAVTQMSAPFSLAILTEYYLRRERWRFFRILYYVFILLLVIDIVTILLKPSGLYATTLYSNNWFLGYKSARVRAVSIPGVMVAAMLSVSRRNKLDLRFWLFFALVLVDALLSKSTGGSVSLVLFVLILFLVYGTKKESVRGFVLKLMNPWVIACIVIGVNLMFAVFQKFEVFEFLITSVLDKDMTLTHRSSIWEASLKQFLANPVLGNGYIVSSDYVLITGVVGGTQPHNLFLAILVYTGLVGMVIYAFLLMKSIMIAGKSGSNLVPIVFFGILTYIIFGISTITMFAPFHYAFFVMLYYLSRHDAEEPDI